MRIFLITGFALDKRAFNPLNLPKDTFTTCDLIPVEKGETFNSYALRMAKSMDLQKGDIIGGVSLGGMLALEIAKYFSVRGVILIASCNHPKMVKKRFLFWSRFSPYFPDFLIRRIFLTIPAILKFQNMLNPDGQALLTDIMGHFPIPLLKSLPPIIRKWEGSEIPPKFRHIHAAKDWMINAPIATSSDFQIIPGHNHLITVSHPNEVRAFILKAVEDFTRG
jgi:pimeloyl-ACP methyl ester carboxylesterase